MLELLVSNKRSLIPSFVTYVYIVVQWLLFNIRDYSTSFYLSLPLYSSLVFYNCFNGVKASSSRSFETFKVCCWEPMCLIVSLDFGYPTCESHIFSETRLCQLPCIAWSSAFYIIAYGLDVVINTQFTYWKRLNNLVNSWFYCFVSPSMHPYLRYGATVTKEWSSLENFTPLPLMLELWIYIYIFFFQ